MVYAQPSTLQEKSTHKFLRDVDIHTVYRISARKPDLMIINKKRQNCKNVDFAVPADHRIDRM